MCLFLSCPSDLSVIIYSSLFFLVLSLVIFFRSKNAILSTIIFSVPSNLVVIFVIFSHSSIFFEFNIQWLEYIALFIWPLLNIYLIIKYFKNRMYKK